jgi:toxin ParE1/3/4
MKRVSLSLAAERDLDEIDNYTIEHFGLDQAIRTTERFLELFRGLAEMPFSGQLRPDLSPPRKAFRYRTVLRSFVIVYEPTDEGIRVARILHGARNLVVELERDTGDDETLLAE